MSDIFHASRMSKKRGSVDSNLKIPERKQRTNQPKQGKQKITQLSIDLNNHKNSKSFSTSKNVTHRLEIKNNNPNATMYELREEVEQLRMQNQSLKEQIKAYKNNQKDLRYQISKLQTQVGIQQEMRINAERDCEKLEEKLKKYAEKIKELFENLIYEKRKNVGLDPNISKLRMVFSPSNSSISNSLNLRKFERQGEDDYLNSVNRFKKKQNLDILKINDYRDHEKNGKSIESFENSPSHMGKGIIGVGQTFGTRY